MATIRTTAARDALIEEAMPWLDAAIRKAARRFGLTPQSADELRSAASLQLVKAAAMFDPAVGVPWPAYAAENIRYGFLHASRDHCRDRDRGVASLDAEPAAGGGSLACRLADPKASDPGELVAARECLTPHPGRRSAYAVPNPAAVAAKAQALQAAVYGAVSAQDMADVVAALLVKAKAGEVGAAKAILALATPRSHGVTVHQQNVIVHPGDLS